MSESHQGATCPVKSIDMNTPGSPALSHFELLDGCQDEARPVFRNSEGGFDYWVFTDNSVILDGLQHPELWSSSVIVPTEPEPPYKWIPVMIDPPDHAKWRQVLAEYFSPKRVKGMHDAQRKLAGELVDRLIDKGECDFVTAISRVFPSTVFLSIMGLPIDDLEKFMAWEDQILHQDGVGEEVNAARMDGMMAVMGYFSGLIQERRDNRDPEADDIVSKAIDWTIDDEPIGDMDLLNCLLLLFMAGLDTVSNQLSYALLHLATHAGYRARIVADPELIP
jgi:cytochrome P450